MTRSKFTEALSNFLYIIHHEFYPDFQFILHTVHRSLAEQHLLFKKGLSLCDGRKIRSKHQDGKAADLYAVKDGKLLGDNYTKIYSDLHEIWEDDYNGRQTIMWTGEDGRIVIDWGHFE